MTMAERINQLWALTLGGKNPSTFSDDDRDLITNVIANLDQGQLRVCDPSGKDWVVHEWLKKSILLYFRIRDVQVMEVNSFSYVDKIPVKKWTGTEKVRVVPPAIARFGSYIESGAILMPSYINIGAYVGAGTMVDTWATVGSCAQIGNNVHLS